jgi:predicted ArsR family transcriptional regulator
MLCFSSCPQCASKILGEGKPELVYKNYELAEWVEKVEEQLDDSGLPHVINKLTREMVDSARKNALTSETAEAIRLVRELRKKEGYVILYRASCN